MSQLEVSQLRVAEDVVLDGRLALFHEKLRWLAVADLHFGYELSQRAAGRLMPMWGMTSVEERLKTLLLDYQPLHLIIVGDLVHDRTSADAAAHLLERLAAIAEPIVLAGNHDRHLTGTIPLLDSWVSGNFHFHHGHCAVETSGMIQIIGHHHPAASVTDGAGLRLKLPAFVQQGSCWILPAFSPWAAGAAWEADAESTIWLCTPKRILRLPQTEPAS
ncbi:MAG: metallophosphoesterase [Verrucomicrobiota bacterium]|nr:metallophosphoesterase [Verrucomicrobiota bacterium]